MIQISKHYVTFGVQFSRHPNADQHPLGMFHDGFAVIEAPDLDVARKIANAIYGNDYAFIYDEPHFIDDGTAAKWHHAGELMRIAWVQFYAEKESTHVEREWAGGDSTSLHPGADQNSETSLPGMYGPTNGAVHDSHE